MSKILNEKLICDVMLPPATIIKRGCDLRTLLVAINQRGNLPPAQRVLREAALAKQPAPMAMPEGWADAYAAFKGAFDNPAARRKMDDEYAQDARRRMREINDAMLAAAPAPAAPAPAPAAQEPEIFGLAYRIDGQVVVNIVGDPYITDGMPVYAAPPAAEQPYSVRKKLTELDIALKFALCNFDHAGTRRDVKKAQTLLEELRALLGKEGA